MSNIVPFQFEAREIRAVDRDGDPWFVAIDVCRILEHTNTTVALSRLDDDEKAALNIIDTSLNGVSQQRSVAIISESGLYSLILTSRKPEAKKFKKWVTSVVLPAIRKTGSYAIDRPKTTGEMLIENAKAFRELEIKQMEHAERLDDHDEQLKVLGASADYHTIMGYAIVIGRKGLTKDLAQTYGRQASGLSRQQGIETGSRVDERYGKVKTYHIDILKQVMGS